MCAFLLYIMIPYPVTNSISNYLYGTTDFILFIIYTTFHIICVDNLKNSYSPIPCYHLYARITD